MAETIFRWLHISDLHVGVDGQNWLWPSFKASWHDDIARQFDQAGAWDAVLFTGDLTQQAATEEFVELDAILAEMWEWFDQLGFRPTLVTIPGNHDLVRPAARAAETLALGQYWDEPELRGDLLAGKGKDYETFLAGRFQSYRLWRDRAVANGLHATPEADGWMPGDAAYRLPVGDATIGIVGLNSAWLQLGARSQGRLAVEPRQLLAVTGNDPDRWTASNSANLLLTHHPRDWLHADALADWNGQIEVNGRFDLHLFGHMHDHDMRSTVQGGGAPRRQVQASSLFGLEKLSDGRTDRIQGYTVNTLSDEGQRRLFTMRPRKLITLKDGSPKLAADVDLGLIDDQYLVHSYARRAGHPAPPGVIGPSEISLASTPDQIAADLETIRYHVRPEPAHRNVRRVDLRQACHALADDRIVWIVADWGMGEDGFLGATLAELNEVDARIYRFDLSEFRTREQFFEDSKARFGASFEALCGNIAAAGPCFVILNDIPVDLATDTGRPSIESDIEAIATILTDFAANARVVLRAQRPPAAGRRRGLVHLRALDEADVATYLRDARPDDETVAKIENVSGLFRHTDGVPSRLDEALRELDVTSIEDVLSANSDFGDRGLAATAPPALVAAVGQIEDPDDPADLRAFELLKALSLLPRGDQLSSIARLHGPRPFRPAHALALTGRALADSNQLTLLGQSGATGPARTLVIPRPVREYVLERMPDEETRSLNRKIIEHFFGHDWKSGEIAGSPAVRQAYRSHCDTHAIANANMLIVRLFRRAATDGDALELEAAIRLASAFAECLITGSHHRSAASLCDDVLPLFPPYGYQRQRTILEHERARSLRMINKTREACDAFEQLDTSQLSKTQNQSVKLNIALGYSTLDEPVPAAAAARACIAIDPQSHRALQAEAILAGQIDDPTKRQAKLKKLLRRCKQRKAHVAAHNVVITLAGDAKLAGDEDQAATLYREVIASASREQDYYNEARAIALLTGLRKTGTRISDQDKSRLINAYHFAHNERDRLLFNQCHKALWDIFEQDGDIRNLLSLFRNSSFIWRLHRQEDEEIQYLSRLQDLQSHMQQPSRDRDYFLVRVVIILGAGPGSTAPLLSDD